jgi:hypothetical protein
MDLNGSAVDINYGEDVLTEDAQAELRCHGKGELCSGEECANPSPSRPSSGLPVIDLDAPNLPVDSDAPNLPPGCEQGITIVRGFPAVAVPDGKALFQAVMSCVELDDYHGIIEFARHGRTQWATIRCGFSVALRPEASTFGQTFPRQLHVRSSSLLHYAICINSFQAVAAIAVVCPHLLRGRCSVSVTRGQDYPAKEESWGAYDLVNILSLLYMEEGDADVSQTGALYSKALPIFAVAERSLSKFPFLDLPTTAERIAAAGPFAEPVLAAFSNAAVKLSPHA